MRVAYADPPYIGCANRYPEKQEVDHQELIAQLEVYDGWALSASSPSIFLIAPLCPKGTRIGSWVKGFCSFKPNVNPAYAWEPVFYKPARGYKREDPTVRDWVMANITLQTSMVGAKPLKFCNWLFEILGMHPDDEFIDLFLGSGAVTKAWHQWQKSRQSVMRLEC